MLSRPPKNVQKIYIYIAKLKSREWKKKDLLKWKHQGLWQSSFLDLSLCCCAELQYQSWLPTASNLVEEKKLNTVTLRATGYIFFFSFLLFYYIKKINYLIIFTLYTILKIKSLIQVRGSSGTSWIYLLIDSTAICIVLRRDREKSFSWQLPWPLGFFRR